MSVTQRQLNYTSVTLIAWGLGVLASHRLAFPLCASGDVGRLLDSSVFVLGQKRFTWHSLAEEQKAQMRDLWKEISVSRVLAPIGCETTHKSEDEWVHQAARSANMGFWWSLSGVRSVYFVCIFLHTIVKWIGWLDAPTCHGIKP